MLTPEHRRSKRIRIPVKRYSETRTQTRKQTRTQTLTKSNNYNCCSKSKNEHDENDENDEDDE